LGCVELVRLARHFARPLGDAAATVAAPTAIGVCSIGLAGFGALSMRAYLDRPVSERYDAYSFADVQLAAASQGGPANVVVIDDFDAVDVRFLDAPDPPTIVNPGLRLVNPLVYSLIVAPTRAGIADATNSATAGRASVAASDPRGVPAVWEVTPCA